MIVARSKLVRSTLVLAGCLAAAGCDREYCDGTTVVTTRFQDGKELDVRRECKGEEKSYRSTGTDRFTCAMVGGHPRCVRDGVPAKICDTATSINQYTEGLACDGQFLVYCYEGYVTEMVDCTIGSGTGPSLLSRFSCAVGVNDKLAWCALDGKPQAECDSAVPSPGQEYLVGCFGPQWKTLCNDGLITAVFSCDPVKYPCKNGECSGSK
jgi:hypothetical protein